MSDEAWDRIKLLERKVLSLQIGEQMRDKQIATLERQVAELLEKWTNTVEAAVNDFMNMPIITSVAASMPKGFSYDPNTRITTIDGISFSDYTSQPVANTTFPPHIIGPHQPCHTFTAETGQLDADEPTIVEAKP